MLPYFLNKSRESNINKASANCFKNWEGWICQYPETAVSPAEETYVILYILSLFGNNKSYSVKSTTYHPVKGFNDLFFCNKKLGSSLVITFLDVIKRMSNYTSNHKTAIIPSNLTRTFQQLGGKKMDLQKIFNLKEYVHQRAKQHLQKEITRSK